MADEQPQQRFAIKRSYLKDASFESPLSPGVFNLKWQPQMKVDINTRSGESKGNDLEVILTISVTAELEEETAFIAEVQMAGIFLCEGFDDGQLQQVMAIACPNVLFPYARAALDDLAVKGGFPPINLQPVNFEALFVQAQQQAAQEGEAAPNGAPDTTH